MALVKVKQMATTILRKESYMDDEQLKRLAEHRYKADDQSILTKYVYLEFWDWFTNFYPLWLAPNVITFVGTIINMVGTLILLSYSPDCAHFAPKWAYLLCALGLFTYQTLDSTDGKQARRTRTSSPLGELFDHGCDSLTQTFLALQVSLALSFGDTKWGVMQFWLGSIYMFYAAHWRTYSTGVLMFGKFDIVETWNVIISVLVVTGIFGPEFWFIQIFGVTIRRCFMTIVALIALYTSVVVLYSIFTQGGGKDGRTVANTSVLTPIVPLTLCLSAPALIYWRSTSGVYDRHIGLFCMAFGMAATKVICRIILAHMSRSPIGLTDTIFLGPLVMVLNQYFGNPISEYYILWLTLIYTFSNLAFYAQHICQQICDYMKIKVFSIPYSPEANGVANGVFKDHH